MVPAELAVAVNDSVTALLRAPAAAKMSKLLRTLVLLMLMLKTRPPVALHHNSAKLRRTVYAVPAVKPGIVYAMVDPSRSSWYTACAAGLVTPLVSMVLVVLYVQVPAATKSASAAKLPAALPPALSATTSVPAAAASAACSLAVGNCGRVDCPPPCEPPHALKKATATT